MLIRQGVAANLVGERFTRLLVIAPAERPIERGGRTRPHWLCRCDCGLEKRVEQGALTRGLTQSCGCLQQELKKTRTVRHGHAKRGQLSRTWLSWIAMMDRCYRAGKEHFEHYGGRGISVCERWKTFENFLADMGERPAGTSLDRKDVDGNYELSNCRWATKKEQMRNTRSNRIVEHQGRMMSLAEAAERAGLSYPIVQNRINRYGWSVARALTEPVRQND